MFETNVQKPKINDIMAMVVMSAVLSVSQVCFFVAMLFPPDGPVRYFANIFSLIFGFAALPSISTGLLDIVGAVVYALPMIRRRGPGHLRISFLVALGYFTFSTVFTAVVNWSALGSTVFIPLGAFRLFFLAMFLWQYRRAAELLAVQAIQEAQTAP